MPAEDILRDQIFQIISENEPLSTKEICSKLHTYGVDVEKESVNSLLYSSLRNSVIRDRNESGIPVWRVRRKQFLAAGGLESKFYHELIQRRIVTENNTQLGFTVKNTKRNIRYSLDIVIKLGQERFDIEIDGLDHVRADALLSIQNQITKKGTDCEIELDWMDNKSSFIPYSAIQTAKVYKWLGDNQTFCIRYHEELLWPKDITRNIWLIEKGWNVVRFWNFQIRDDMDGCIQELKDVMKRY